MTGSETSDRAYFFVPKNAMSTENRCLEFTRGRSCIWCMAGVACNVIIVLGFMVNGKVLWGVKFDFMSWFDNLPCLSHIYIYMYVCLCVCVCIYIYIPKYSTVDNLSSYSVYCHVVYKHVPCWIHWDHRCVSVLYTQTEREREREREREGIYWCSAEFRSWEVLCMAFSWRNYYNWSVVWRCMHRASSYSMYINQQDAQNSCD